MTLEEQQKYFQYFTEEMKGIMMRKGDDYAASSDRLSNFKMAGPIAGMTAEQNCLSLMATKVARLGQLIASNKGPRNESVHDSLIDLANYTVLLAMLIEDHPRDVSPSVADDGYLKAQRAVILENLEQTQKHNNLYNG
jgi:hypothetical protein